MAGESESPTVRRLLASIRRKQRRIEELEARLEQVVRRPAARRHGSEADLRAAIVELEAANAALRVERDCADELLAAAMDLLLRKDPWRENPAA